jgi:hypothetical protein
MSDEFNKEDLEFYLPETFKGLTKEYMLKCIFNEQIQKSWYPRDGDVMVGSTGNIWTISGHHRSNEKLGGDIFFFGGFLCNTTGGCTLDDVSCFSMNRDGKRHRYTENGSEFYEYPYHSKFSEFRYIPYPHENTAF